MKRILSIVGISVVSLVLATGCSSSAPTPETEGESVHHSVSMTGDNQAGEYAINVGYMSAKRFIEIVEVAGEKAGWRVTKFKPNALIVEKNGKSTTIKLENGYISGDHADNPPAEFKELREAIIEQINDSSESH